MFIMMVGYDDYELAVFHLCEFLQSCACSLVHVTGIPQVVLWAC